MPVFENFPYTNFHELNLDYVASQIQKLSADVAKVESMFTDTLVDTINEYIAEHLSTFILTASYDEATHSIIINEEA